MILSLSEKFSILNSYTPEVLFMGHEQTDVTPQNGAILFAKSNFIEK